MLEHVPSWIKVIRGVNFFIIKFGRIPAIKTRHCYVNITQQVLCTIFKLISENYKFI